MSLNPPRTQCSLEPAMISNLRELHRLNLDSAKGFEEVANDLGDSTLSDKLRRIAKKRRKQAQELAGIVYCNGELIERKGSWLAGLHRVLISLKSAVTSGDECAILTEAERGEDQIQQAYEDVLLHSPGSAVNHLLQRQYVEVKDVHELIRELRDCCQTC